MIVVDASVATKWFVLEPGSRQAEAVLARDEPKIAPEHILAEVGQALLRHHRAHRIDLEHCRLALAKLRDWVDLLPAGPFATDALDLAAAARCSVYDGLYVAVAERFDAMLITADAKLRASLEGTPWAGRVSLLVADS